MPATTVPSSSPQAVKRISGQKPDPKRPPLFNPMQRRPAPKKK